jgi:hypothetical protein
MRCAVTTITMAKKISPKNGLDGSHVWTSLRSGSYAALDEQMLAEPVLKRIADEIKKTDSFGTLFHLIDEIPRRGNNFDWNVGGILQHFEADGILSAMQLVGDGSTLYDSVGVAWVIGQKRNRNAPFVNHLYATIEHAKSSDAWWQAAFSLEHLGEDNAINLLKRSIRTSPLRSLEYYLNRLDDKRSLIGILLLCDTGSRAAICAKIKEVLLRAEIDGTTVNCCWLAGRLRIFDDAIVARLVKLTKSATYDVKHYAFFALQNYPTDKVRALFEKELQNDDASSRKFAARGLRAIANESSVAILESALFAETEPVVAYEISKTIYRLKDPSNAERRRIRQDARRHETGHIDRAGIDPDLYDIFASAQDPERICFSLIKQGIGARRIVNPIDANVRTGVMTRQLLDGLEYGGVLHGADESSEMCAYATKHLNRECNLQKETTIVQGSLGTLAKKTGIKSNLIVSMSDYGVMSPEKFLRMLKDIHALLADDGEFYTVGWDELYNDGVLAMWFKYVPDGIPARNLGEWRVWRTQANASRSNSGLTWFKRGLHAPLRFRSMDESARVMGYLFGRDAAQYAIRNNRTEWSMSLGITRDSKKGVERAIATLEKRLRAEKN